MFHLPLTLRNRLLMLQVLDLDLLLFHLLPLVAEAVLQLFYFCEQFIPLLLLHHFIVFDLLVHFLAILLPLLQSFAFFIQFLIKFVLVYLLFGKGLGELGPQFINLLPLLMRVILLVKPLHLLILHLSIHLDLQRLVYLTQVVDRLAGLRVHPQIGLVFVLCFFKFRLDLINLMLILFAFVLEDHQVLSAGMYLLLLLLHLLIQLCDRLRLL